MAQPNQNNPTFLGSIFAPAYGDLGGKGTNIVAVTTNGVTAVNVFGTTNPFNGTVTGAFVVAVEGVAANITILNDSLTVATIAKGTTTAALVGAPSVANATIVKDGTFGIVSDAADGNAVVYITYSVVAP